MASTLTNWTFNRDILRLKVALLTRGVYFPSNEQKGREGGAGPTLGQYFLLNGDILVNAPIRSKEQVDPFQALQLQQIMNNKYKIVSFEDKSYDVTLIASPQFYQMRLVDGTPMMHVALVHGVDCLATTIIQHCDYFDSGLECLYCSIPLSLELGQTIFQKSPEQFLQVLSAAQKEGRAQHLTLTMGSPARHDRGAKDYVEFVSTLRKVTTIPIHVQIEPPTSQNQFQALKDAGVDTVGIHLEIFDDQLRRQYCPGKYQHASFNDYLAAWREAVGIFGRGQVSTFILLGLGETAEQLHNGFKTTIELGVIPVPVPCRPNPGSHLERKVPTYINNLDQIVDIYLDCARLLFKAQLNPFSHHAGCIRCRGCSAITEAYQIIRAEQEGKY